MAYCRDTKFAGFKHSAAAQLQRSLHDITGLCEVEENDVAYCLEKLSR